MRKSVSLLTPACVGVNFGLSLPNALCNYRFCGRYRHPKTGLL
jgi:hypothetical protein